MLRHAVMALMALAGAASEPNQRYLEFEAGFEAQPLGSRATGMVGKGWADNSSWADIEVHYSAENKDPHRGAAAQMISVTRLSSGAAQLIYPINLRAEVAMRFSVWLRGRPGQSVSLQLRQAGSPYKIYAENQAMLSAEWQEFSTQGITPADEGGVALIRASEVMDFYVDDARIEDLSGITNAAPVKFGNLISGGSFETAIPPFGWSTRLDGDPDSTWGDTSQRTDANGAVGNRSLRIDIPAHGPTSATSSPVFIPNGNRIHSASAWLRSNRSGTTVRLSLDNTNLVSDHIVGTEWQRYTLSGIVPYVDYSRLRISAQSDELMETTLWIDGAAIEESPTPSNPFRSNALVEMALTLDRPGHILHDGERVAAKLTLAPQPPAGSVLDVSVDDLLGGSVRLPSLALPVVEVVLPELPGRTRGMFKLCAVVRDKRGVALSAPAELVWARLQRPRELDPSRSYFGLHIPLAPDYIAMARAAGVRWIRLHDSSMIGKWPIAEPEAGQWRFYDTQIDAVHRAGLGIIGMLDGAPARVSSRKREGGYWSIWHIPDMPDAMEAWSRYVRTVVSHYRGRIDTWEIWNEPWGEWWSGAGGSPEEYVALMRAAYCEAKRVHPEASVLGVNTYRGRDWTERVLAIAGTESFDAFSFHDYSDVLYGGHPSFAQRQVDAFAAAMAKVGTVKPLWNTEGGLLASGSWYAPETGGMSVRTQPAYIIRYDVCMIAAGVKVSALYAVHTNPSMGEVVCRLDEYDRAVKPILAARAALAALIDGAGMPTYCEPRPGLDCHLFPPEQQGQVAVYWSNDGKDHVITLQPGSTALDVFGSPLTTSAGQCHVGLDPVYLIHRP